MGITPSPDTPYSPTSLNLMIPVKNRRMILTSVQWNGIMAMVREVPWGLRTQSLPPKPVDWKSLTGNQRQPLEWDSESELGPTEDELSDMTDI
jgi:hypothetical protein